MRILFMLVGIQGAGKSYDIKKLNLEYMTISADTMRVMNGMLMVGTNDSNYIDNLNDNYVWDQLMQVLENRFTYGQTTILDTTSLYDINNILDLARAYRYRVVFVVYDKFSIDECYNNVLSRKYNNNIPYDVLIKFQTRLIDFKKKYKNYETDLSLAIKTWDKFYFHEDLFNQYEDICIIPDLHGSIYVFNNFLKENNMLENTNIAYIFLGDFIDRGEDNVAIIKQLIWLATLSNVYFIIGNHDLRLFNWAYDRECKGRLFKKTLSEIYQKEDEKEIENIKKSLRKISNKFKDYLYFDFKGQKYFLNHAGIEKMTDSFPACFLNGKKTFGYREDVDSYESYIKVGNKWKENHPDIIQIFGHRNCFPSKLENSIKINDNAYCIESNVEYGDPLITFYLKDKNTKMYDNPNKNTERIKDNLQFLIQEKVFAEHNLKSINYTKNVFYKKIWNDITVKARGLYRYIDSNEIAGRGYPKFFNIDEQIDTKIENWIKNATYPVCFYKKYNGFLGVVFYNKTLKVLEYATKSIAYGKIYNDYLEELFTDKQKEYITEICKIHNVTFLFECLNMKDDEHPIKIKKSELILLDIIENTEEFVYKNEFINNLFKCKEIVAVAQNESELIKLVDHYSNSLDIDFEGVVLQDNNKRMLKIKSLYYNIKKLLRTISYTKTIKDVTNSHYTTISNSLAYLVAKNLLRNNSLDKWQDITIDDVREYYKQIKV